MQMFPTDPPTLSTRSPRDHRHTPECPTLTAAKGWRRDGIRRCLGWGALNNPQHYGEFKPRISKPAAPICGTNKWESSFQHWEPANPEQTSRFGQPRVTQRVTGAAAACLWVHWGTATSCPLEQVRAPTRPSRGRSHRNLHTVCTRQLPWTQSKHIATLQGRDRCLL